MNTRQKILTIIMFFTGVVAVDLHAQERSSTTSSASKDVTVMKQLQDALPPADRELSQAIRLDYGPLTYRLSTAQGLLFLATQKPLIVRLNPDDGLSDRILGGVHADPKDFPWQVALLNSTSGTLFCGGSHLGDGWIVTAAHCVKHKGVPLKKKDLLALIGTVDLTKGGSRLALIQDPIFHEKYDPATKANDIALVRIAPNKSLPTAKIPPSSVESSLISTQLTVSGWGLTTEAGNISTDLLKVGVPVVTLQKCADAYPDRPISNTQICAGISGRDSCQGDSGGPLTGLEGKDYVLVGIVSFGKGCGRDGFPGVYTRAGAYRDWIKQKSGL